MVGGGVSPTPGSSPRGEPPDPDCFFCDRLRNRKEIEDWCVYEDDLLVVAHQVEIGEPTYLGTLLIQTKRHSEGLAGLTDKEAERLGLLAARISRALKEVLKAEWTYAYCFTAAFRHVHMIIDARYPGVPREHVRLGIHEWPDAPRGDPEAVRSLVQQVRARLANPSRAKPLH
jgi:histidine triad (HIT) family protein